MVYDHAHVKQQYGKNFNKNKICDKMKSVKDMSTDELYEKFMSMTPEQQLEDTLKAIEFNKELQKKYPEKEGIKVNGEILERIKIKLETKIKEWKTD